MQVTLNIDANLSGSVSDVFSSLSDDEKKNLARGIMQEFLKEEHGLERKVYENQKLEELRKTKTEIWTHRYGRVAAADATEEQLRGSSEFQDRIKGYKSTRDRIVEEIIKVAVEEYRAAARELVEKDPQIQAVKETVLTQIREDFPKYVHDAMAAWFVQGLTNMSTGMMNALSLASNASSLATQLAQNAQNR